MNDIEKSRSVLLVAGETSADRYGAALATRLRAYCGARQLHFFGTGGDEMQRAGVDVLCHIRDLAGIGIGAAIRNLHRYYRTFHMLTEACRERRPAAAVLLDFPDFNLRLAKRLKRQGIKVIYYISPQLWAWRSGRIKIIRRYVDRMLVILPFEEEFYRVRGVKVDFVGHPLLEDFAVNGDRKEFERQLGLDPARKTVALLPGSRHMEVEHILPVFLEASLDILRRTPAQFLISVAPAIDARQVSAIMSRILGNEQAYFHTVTAPARAVLANSDFGLVKCGTSTLEAALVGNPFLIVYKVSPLNWCISNILIRSKYKGLVNLIAKQEIVPEYLQGAATPAALSRTALNFLEQPEMAAEMRARLAGIRALLGSRRASDRAAALVAGYLE